MKLRKEDEVQVISGKDRGKKGKIHRTLPKENRILVEGINIVKKHQKPRTGVRQAGIIDMVAPLYVSKVMLLCTKCQKPTKIGFRLLTDGSKVRVCKRCDEVID